VSVGGIGGRKFGKGDLPLRMIHELGHAKRLGPVRGMEVHDLSTLMQILPRGIAPFREGVTLVTLRRDLHITLEARKLKENLGISEDGIKVEQFARSITSGEAYKHLTIEPREKWLIRGSDAYNLAYFNAVVGMYCEPKWVLYFSLKNALKRRDIPDFDKALLAKRYFSFNYPNVELDGEQANYAADMAKEFTTTKFEDPGDARGKLLFIAFLSLMFYPGEANSQKREMFVTLALGRFYPKDPSAAIEAATWIGEELAMIDEEMAKKKRAV